MATNETRAGSEALDRARRKAYKRLIPLLFISYVIAYIDRVNVAFAKLTMSKDMPAFDNDVIGTGAGLFFLGFFSCSRFRAQSSSRNGAPENGSPAS